MRKSIVRLILTAATLSLPFTLAAQRGSVETDIFGNLQFRSSDLRYSALLEKDIFNNLTFTDSRRNKIVFEEEYLAGEYPAILENESARRDFFRRIVNRHRRDEGYEARFSVDIFGTVITEDNRGNRTDQKTDIFGHESYEETHDGVKMSISRDLHGTLQYRYGDGSASLGTAFNMGKWVYEDSDGNRMEFGKRTWDGMIRRFGDDERIFRFLIDEFLHGRPSLRD
jgi:hypothetical protein